MRNLIPEVRVNKNGVPVTKHVKAETAATTNRSMPVPALPASKNTKQGHKPTKKQITPRAFNLRFGYKYTDAELTDRVDPPYGHDLMKNWSFEASDTEVYEVCSVVEPGNAAALLQHGVRSKEEAIKFLEQNHLTRLLTEDISSMTDAMLKSKVSAEDFFEFRQVYPYHEDYELAHYTGAAEVYAVKGLRNFKFNDPDELNLIHQTIIGRISAADLKAFGAQRLKRSIPPEEMTRTLYYINRGETSYTAEQLIEYMDNSSVGATTAVRLADRYDIDFAGALEEPWSAFHLVREMEQHHDFTNEKEREIITYGDRFEVSRIEKAEHLRIGKADIIELFEAGVEPEEAVRLLDSNASVRQIIAIKSEGVAPSVSDGWL